MQSRSWLIRPHTLLLIAKLFGEDVAAGIANGAEYEWNKDSQHDPFAKLNGLVD
ncbi:hypothetical protein [Dyadobacter sp. CY351]|uniref:hypothetical protein n=1 Tax=Dyadobacter sp. CY351 TaxID=2909337 RepID=UPI001F2B60CA|nr:hypothetical protein [Dyadobacter sp. CY351]MCF2518365.1 hypothetical protein [Dyadobacter sp. CY351]